MSSVIDRRLADRRHQVRETWARRRLRWVVAGAGLVLLGAVAYALLDSPWLSVDTIEVDGATRAPVGELLADAGVEPGTPTIRVRPGRVATALESNPWVADAEVTVTWPGTVEVVVEERVPAAWVDTGDRWMLVAGDGTVLEPGRPTTGEPRLEATVGGLRPGDEITDPGTAALVGFLGLLPAELAAGAVGEVAAGSGVVVLDGPVTVLIGDGSDLAAKAAALVAVLEGGVRGGSTVTVVSPTRPAVSSG